MRTRAGDFMGAHAREQGGRDSPDEGGATTRTLRWAALSLAFGLSLLLAPRLSIAAPGVDADSITFGQSAVFSGPTRDLGLSYRRGILVAFEERNGQGGVGGRSLKLISLDDGYEPDQAAANAARFAAENDVFAVIGGVGTPTARRIAPKLRTAGIPFVGQVTGADFLRDAERYPNVISLRAGYLDETRVLVDHIVRDRGKTRLGIIYQDDAFGRSVLRNYREVLEEHDLPILAKSTYSRNTHAVHSGLFSLAKADLDAILLVGTYAANAEIINLANTMGHEYIMANLSFVLSRELRKRIDAPSDRILVTEVVPDATDTGTRIVRSYQRAFRAMHVGHKEPIGSPFNEVSLEGYILGRFIIAVFERMGDDLTRESFLDRALSSGPFAIDGWAVGFLPRTNTGSTYTRLTDFGG